MQLIVRGEPPQLEDDAADGEDAPHWSGGIRDFMRVVLTVDAENRPTPKEMLAHYWIVESMSRRPNMARWISEVWGFSPTTASSK